jgi:hypothetical protein
MPTFTPTLTCNPNYPSYNVGQAETNSWIPQSSPDANRAIFARATYLVNPQDIKVSLSADNINVDLNSVVSEINTLNGISTQIPGFALPTFTKFTPTYYGSTNNFQTVQYFNNGTLVATLSFTYVGGVPNTNDALIESATRIV